MVHAASLIASCLVSSGLALRTAENPVVVGKTTMGMVSLLQESQQNDMLPKGLQKYMATEERIKSAKAMWAAQKPFMWTRFGDGEMSCAANLGLGGNCNGESYRGTMCSDLQSQMLQWGGEEDDSNFFVAIGTWYSLGGFARFLEEHPLQSTFDGFVNSYYFPLIPTALDMSTSVGSGAASTTPWAQHPLPALRNRRVVLVGPNHLEQLRVTLNYEVYIEVPHSAAYAKQGELMEAMTKESNARPNDNVVFLIAAGTSTNVLAFKLRKQLGHKDTLIDIGSRFDGWSGVKSRITFQDLTIGCKQNPYFVSEEVWKFCESKIPAADMQTLLSLAPTQL